MIEKRINGGMLRIIENEKNCYFMLKLYSQKAVDKAFNTLAKNVAKEHDSRTTIVKLFNALNQQKNALKYEKKFHDIDKYEEFFSIKFKTIKLSESIIVIEFDYIDEQKEQNECDLDNTPLAICNGNYKTVENREINGVQSTWVKIKSNKTHYNAKSISIDIETDFIDDVYSCVSFSMGSNIQSWYMTTTEITDNDTTIKNLLDCIVDVAPKKNNVKSIRCEIHNINFDGIYILKYLYKNEFKLTEKVDCDNEYSFFYANSLLKFDCIYKSCHIEFIDTLRLMSQSLDVISKSFVKQSDIIIKKSDTNYVYNQGRKIGDMYSDNEIIYCINDVVVTSYISNFFKNVIFGKLRLTASSCAFSEFKLSLRFGVFDTETLIYWIKYAIMNDMVSEKNYHVFIKKIGNQYFLNDYYGECVPVPSGFSDFQKFIIDYKLIKTDDEIEKRCFEVCPYFCYMRNVKKFTFIKTLQYLSYDLTKPSKWKKELYEEMWFYYFPKNNESQDKFFREMYFGGITAVNPDYQGIEQKNLNGFSLDINSSYPDKMKNHKMPYGEYQHLTDFDEIQNIDLNEYNDKFVLLKIVGFCQIKKSHIPLLINKSFAGQGGQIWSGEVNRWLTVEEFTVFKKTYNTDVVIQEMVIFNSCNNLFTAYYDRYLKLKQSFKGINEGLYSVSKVLLNGLYGKFGENIFMENSQSHIIGLDNTDSIHFTTYDVP